MNTNETTAFHCEYLSALLDSLQASVVATDSNFVIEYWNKCAETIFGFEAKEVMGKPETSVLKFDYLSEDEKSAREQVIQNGIWKGKLAYQKKDGERLILDSTVSVVKSKEGTVLGYAGIHRDVTEYSRVRNELSTLLSTFSNIDDNFFIVDKELRIAFVDEKSNRNLQSYYGITYAAGEDILVKLPANRKVQVVEGFTKALQGIKTSYDVNIQNTEGKSIWLQGSYFPIKEHDGTISHACLIVREVTAQKDLELAHEKLYRSRKLFETFMENSPILSWITDVGGTIRYLNPAYLRTYRLKKQCIGNSVFDIFPKSIAQHLCENNELVLQTNQVIKTIERGITPDQKEHIYQVVKFPVNSDDGTYIGGWAIDLTEEISLRENLNNSLNDLQRSEKELKEALQKEHYLNNLKSRFVSMASHEFRTPLSTMLSSAFLLERYTATEQQFNRVKHISKIKESIHHMNALLEDFLSLGKLDEGKTFVAPTDFDLPQLITEVIQEIEPIKRQGQQIYFDSNEAEEIHSDKRLLRNILVNLLNNACKFSNENKRIWIKTEKNKGALRITVKDEGIGICTEDQKHLFETFFRGKNVQNIQGTGLGLHIIKRYTELLQGCIQLDSELDKGTTISLLLPGAYLVSP